MGVKNSVIKKSAAALLAINMLCCGPIANISIAEQVNTYNDIALIATQVLNNMTSKNDEKMNADTIVADIQNNNNAVDYYGKKVSGYTATNQNSLAHKYQWQIFYIGKNPNLSESATNNTSHIYLTTTDYIDLNDWASQSSGNALFVNNETGNQVDIDKLMSGRK